MTALPNGVSYKTEGELVFVSQRGYFAPPYVSCMFAALCSVLEWMGLNLPLARKKSATPPENFVWTLHKASGAQLDSGTTIAETRVAMQKLLPDVPLKFANGKPVEVLDLLDRGAAVRVAVRCAQLPKPQRRFVGYGYSGKHAVAIMAHRKAADGSDEVLWFDPMARPVPTWKGEWVKWSSVLPAFIDKGGNVTVTFGYKSEAIPAAPEPPINSGGGGDTGMIFSNVVERQRGVVGASTPVLHPETLAQVLTVPAGTTVKLVGITPDGKYRGILVNIKAIAGDNPKVALIDASAVSNLTVDDPSATLQEQLDAANAKAAQDVADAQSIVGRHA